MALTMERGSSGVAGSARAGRDIAPANSPAAAVKTRDRRVIMGALKSLMHFLIDRLYNRNVAAGRLSGNLEIPRCAIAHRGSMRSLSSGRALRGAVDCLVERRNDGEKQARALSYAMTSTA